MAPLISRLTDFFSAGRPPDDEGIPRRAALMSSHTEYSRYAQSNRQNTAPKSYTLSADKRDGPRGLSKKQSPASYIVARL
eukprot:scaffold74445_cov40-Prasinocladus_malaysianus.AAC.3